MTLQLKTGWCFPRDLNKKNIRRVAVPGRRAGSLTEPLPCSCARFPWCARYHRPSTIMMNYSSGSTTQHIVGVFQDSDLGGGTATNTGTNNLRKRPHNVPSVEDSYGARHKRGGEIMGILSKGRDTTPLPIKQVLSRRYIVQIKRSCDPARVFETSSDPHRRCLWDTCQRGHASRRQDS